jgi:histidine ammonia-lyase
LTAAQAFEYRKPLKSGVVLDEIHTFLRTKVAFAANDRVFADDIEKGIEIIQNREIIDLVERVMKEKELTWDAPHLDEFEIY